MQVAKLIPVALSIDMAINKSSNYILGRRNEYFWGAFKFLFSFLENFNIKHLY